MKGSRERGRGKGGVAVARGMALPGPCSGSRRLPAGAVALGLALSVWAGAAGRTARAAGSYAWPLAGRVTAGYAAGQHRGIDIAGESGDTVSAAEAGDVAYAGRNPRGGTMVTVDHGDGYSTTYLGLAGLVVGRGSSVGRGEKIGTLGAVGDPSSEGAHLHLGAYRTASREDKEYTDPMALLGPAPAQPTESPEPAPQPATSAQPAHPQADPAPVHPAPEPTPIPAPNGAEGEVGAGGETVGDRRPVEERGRRVREDLRELPHGVADPLPAPRYSRDDAVDSASAWSSPHPDVHVPRWEASGSLGGSTLPRAAGSSGAHASSRGSARVMSLADGLFKAAPAVGRRAQVGSASAGPTSATAGAELPREAGTVLVSLLAGILGLTAFRSPALREALSGGVVCAEGVA